MTTPATTSTTLGVASTFAELPAPILVAKTGAEQFLETGFAEVAGLRVGLIANHTSVTSAGHLADLMAADPNMELVALFGPEHGLRGEALAGEIVADSVDPATGLEVFSLYGTSRKPTPEMLAGLDVLIYDIQDVGARFYTFISTMGLAMQAAAEAEIGFVVLDRPNPHGGTSIAGFTRTPDLGSFVSQYPIPSTYGMTAGELALAIKGEGWLDGLDELDLQIVELQGWTRETRWDDWPMPWVAPSPALPTLESAQAYPGVVLFEATDLDYGRGTDAPFLVIKDDGLDGNQIAEDLNSRGLAGVRFEAVPDGIRYVITDPSEFEPVSVGVHVVEAFQNHSPDPIITRPEFFDLLAGSSQLRMMLQSGVPASEIVRAWAPDIEAFEQIRLRYLLY